MDINTKNRIMAWLNTALGIGESFSVIDTDSNEYKFVVVDNKNNVMTISCDLGNGWETLTRYGVKLKLDALCSGNEFIVSMTFRVTGDNVAGAIDAVYSGIRDKTLCADFIKVTQPTK